MSRSGLVVLLTAVVPLTAALISNRSTSLVHATVWAIAAWAGWLAAIATETVGWSYLALGLTGCAGVAVLGARWPGAMAWNFVVGGLLVVLSLPMAESAVLGSDLSPGSARTAFLASLLGVTLINYMPTRLWPGVIFLVAGCGWGLFQVQRGEPVDGAIGLLVGIAPWAAWLQLLRRPNLMCDRLWLDYRDSFGLVWGQRLRDQFNRAAANAGWRARIAWTGVWRGAESLDTEMQQAETLSALMKRFGLPRRP
jgi:hypothetical protein